ncbi:unnamed protein product [Acanthoscelides obtectus]|uniref:Uncharacterized protein n=1 Tax=Acanthoscelides obtectus TaxID=200917 RepID=A0A9P0L5W0_ACAOB|nr:unnamed protein product [Acanthoscelides obtectus]CAK1646051.1 hypothetical protein AOBTE_LOCUS14416 [Acanthoscelides obtectus]
MVEIRRLKSKVSKVYELVDGPEDHPLFGIGNRELEQNDNNPDDLSEDIENFNLDFAEHSEENPAEERPDPTSEIETVRKLQEILAHIAYCLATLLHDTDAMDRSVFSIHDRSRPPVLPDLNGDDIEAAGGDLPVDVRLIALLLSQGDNRHVEELLRTVHQNVIVNVNLSYYFKVMIFLLTFNTLLLFKWMLWDTLPSILD